jgi:hypothetical protein
MTFVESYESIVTGYPMLSSFVKFGILATAGEVIAHRIKMKAWPDKSFGILPKAFAWGILGILILFAFKIFSTGVPQICGTLLPLSGDKNIALLLTAFYISLFMNCIFAPVMMLTHRLIDIKIEAGGGRFSSLFTSTPPVGELFQAVNWDKMWGFVFKKTIPFFWIPAHTITFLLPPAWRILFAAVLSVFLGLLLAYADNKDNAKVSVVSV